MSEDELKKYHHFKIKTSDGIELDLIETKYYEELLDLYNKEKEKNKRNKKIMIDKLDKLKNGVRNDFSITLGKQQPLWEDNYTNYISKDMIRAKIKELENKKEYCLTIWVRDEIRDFQELLEEK